VAAYTATKLGLFPSQTRRVLLVNIKDDDEAFEQEMAAAPWGYGQSPDQKVDMAMAAVRLRGMWTEASVIALELVALRAEIARLKEKCGEVDTKK
jgi:hypothetical protein